MGSRDFWNAEASTFDAAADHGLHDPIVRESWRRMLARVLPPGPLRVLDVGCGTGSLSLLMAQAGHVVTGIDFAPAMIEQARAKAATQGLEVTFVVQDAGNPEVEPQSFDVVLGRHILWAIPDISTDVVLERWAQLLVPDGLLILIEGFWHTGAGLSRQSVMAALPSHLDVLHLEDLAADSSLWGGPVSDERYVVVARRSSLQATSQT